MLLSKVRYNRKIKLNKIQNKNNNIKENQELIEKKNGRKSFANSEKIN